MKSNKTVPQTSKDAFKSLTDAHVSAHYALITKSLAILKTATAERIAIHCGLDHLQVTRRISELISQGIVWRPGGKMPTKTGRSAMLIQLCSDSEPLSPPVEKSDKKAKSVATYSKKIKELSTPFIQPSLF